MTKLFAILIFLPIMGKAQVDSLQLYEQSVSTLELIKTNNDTSLLEVYKNSIGPKYMDLEGVQLRIAEARPWLVENAYPAMESVEYTIRTIYIEKNIEENRLHGVNVIETSVAFIFNSSSNRDESYMIEFVYNKVWEETIEEPEEHKLLTIHYVLDP